MKERYAHLIESRKKESEEKRYAVISAAVKLMLEGKTFGVTELASAAGVHRNTVYNYPDILEMMKVYMQGQNVPDDKSLLKKDSEIKELKALASRLEKANTSMNERIRKKDEKIQSLEVQLKNCRSENASYKKQVQIFYEEGFRTVV